MSTRNAPMTTEEAQAMRILALETQLEKLSKPSATARELAEKIAASLFTNGSGEKAERLVLRKHSETDLGGWCEAAVRDRIEDLLRPHIK